MVRAGDQRVDLRIVGQQRHRVDQILEPPVLDEDARADDQEDVVGDAEPRARRRPVRWIEEVRRRAGRHDQGILAIAATDHLDLLGAEHHDRGGAAGVEQVGPREEGLHHPARQRAVAGDRLLRHDRVLPQRLVVARPHERDRQAPGGDTPGSQREPLVGVDDVRVCRDEPGDLRHVEPEATGQRPVAGGQLGDAAPDRADLELIGCVGELAAGEEVVTGDRDAVPAPDQPGPELEHQPHAASTARLSADVMVDERDVHLGESGGPARPRPAISRGGGTPTVQYPLLGWYRPSQPTAIRRWPVRRRTCSVDILDTADAGPIVIRGSLLRLGGYLLGTLATVVSSAVVIRHLGVIDTGHFLTVTALVTIVATVSDLGLTGFARARIRHGPEIGRATLPAQPARHPPGARARRAVDRRAVRPAGRLPRRDGARNGDRGSRHGVLGRSRRMLDPAPGRAAVRVGGRPAARDPGRRGDRGRAAGAGRGGAAPVLCAATADRDPGAGGDDGDRRPRLAPDPGTSRPGSGAGWSGASCLSPPRSSCRSCTSRSLRSWSRCCPAPRRPDTLACRSASWPRSPCSRHWSSPRPCPLLARAARDDAERFNYASRRLVETMVLAGCGLALALFLGAAFAIHVIAGSGYDQSVEVLRILAVALLGTFVIGARGYALLVTRPPACDARLQRHRAHRRAGVRSAADQRLWREGGSDRDGGRRVDARPPATSARSRTSDPSCAWTPASSCGPPPPPSSPAPRRVCSACPRSPRRCSGWRSTSPLCWRLESSPPRSARRSSSAAALPYECAGGAGGATVPPRRHNRRVRSWARR